MKLTENQLLNMRYLLNEFKDECHCMTKKELEDLYDAVSMCIYEQQIKKLADYIDEALPGPDANEEEWDCFYKKKWTISFGGKTATFENDATIYGSMSDAIREFIDICL